MKHLVCSAFAAVLLFAQQPAQVEGTVVNALSRESVRKATVVLRPLNSATGSGYSAETDENGRFSIARIENGSYIVTVDREGFTTEVAGVPGTPPQELKIDAGQSVKNFVVKLIPLCVIAGRVVDEDGDPMRGATVQAMHYAFAAGKRQLVGNVAVTTGNQGDFRLFGLLPGTYLVRASANRRPSSFLPPGNATHGPPPVDFAATYFPGVTETARATALKLAAGSEFRNIDIPLRRERVYSARGKLPEDSTTGITYSVQMVQRGNEGPATHMSQSRTNNTFEFHGLLPGSYVLTAIRTEGNRRSFATQILDVAGSDLNEITLDFHPSKDISGSVRFEGRDKISQNLQVHLRPEIPSAFSVGSQPVQADGTFVLHDVPPAEFELFIGPAEGAYIKSIQFGDRLLPGRRADFSQSTGRLTITMATDMGDIEGTVLLANGDPAGRVRVTAIPYGHILGRTELSKSAFTDAAGAFHLKDVAPGEYKVFAWEGVEVGAPQDPEFRKPFESFGVSVNLASNGHASVQVTAMQTRKQ